MSRFVLDLEANGLEPDTMWCICTYDLDTKEHGQWNVNDNIDPYLWLDAELAGATELIGHNIINYDLPVLKHLLGWEPSASCKLTDTLVLSRLAKPDREGGHSLREWGSRLGFSKGDVTDFSQFTSEMVDYCKRDVDLTARVHDTLLSELSAHDWSGAIELEHDTARIITEQEQNGFAFDVDGAHALLETIDSYLRDLDLRISFPRFGRVRGTGFVEEPFKMDGSLKLLVRKYLGVDDTDDVVAGPFNRVTIQEYNNDSNPQLKEWLLSNGWQPDEYTPKGSPKITESSLRKMGGVGEALAERGVWVHRQRLVKGLLENVREDGRISAGGNTIGTPTGRMRHSRVVNIPGGHSVLGTEIRALFTVSPGKVLVGYDAEQLELRVLAHYIGNQDYIDVILHDDPHTFASDAASLNDRQRGKTLNYAFVYGAGDARLGELLGGGAREGKAIKKALLAAIPGLEGLIKTAKRAAKRGYVIGLDGRKMWLREEHKALNTLIQGGGAVVMKKIAQLLDGKVDKTKCMKVCDMHDEAQWECDPEYADTLAELIHESFVEATQHFKLKCPHEANVQIGRNWAETH